MRREVENIGRGWIEPLIGLVVFFRHGGKIQKYETKKDQFQNNKFNEGKGGGRKKKRKVKNPFDLSHLFAGRC
jgi:hypothetical protein